MHRIAITQRPNTLFMQKLGRHAQRRRRRLPVARVSGNLPSDFGFRRGCTRF